MTEQLETVNLNEYLMSKNGVLYRKTKRINRKEIAESYARGYYAVEEPTDEMLWEHFIENMVAVSDGLPKWSEQLGADLLETKWKISEMYSYSYGAMGKSCDNIVVSMNPAHGATFGTMAQIYAHFGAYPSYVIVIANSLTPGQQAWVAMMQSKMKTRDDRQGYVSVRPGYDWEVVYC